MSHFSALIRDRFVGRQVKYVLLRYHVHINQIPYNLGGATLAFVEEDGLVSRFSVSYCSVKDNFSRQMGRTICLARLGSASDIPVSQRVDVKEFIERVEMEWWGMERVNQ